jgi:hypothetical protein
MLDLAVGAFNYGYSCGLKKTRLIVTDDGLLDGAQWIRQRAAVILEITDPALAKAGAR